MSEFSVAPLNPEGYPLEQAFTAFDRYTAVQNGEPQMITFGETIDHYAWTSKSKPDAIFPNRKPMLIGSYGNFEQMAVDLENQAETDFELDPYRKRLVDILTSTFGERREELPLTTSQEMELEAFELSCLSLDDIRQAASERAAEQEDGAAPTLTIVNAETGDSQTLTLDAATLIATGELELERKREKRDGSNDVTIKTDILFGKFLAVKAAELGIDADSSAVLDSRRRKPTLYSASPIFIDSRRSIWGYDHVVSNDIWTENGEYAPADADLQTDRRPPRHSLSDALNYRRVDNYDASDFIDSAQDVINTQLEATIGRMTGDEEKLVLQPIRPIEESLDQLLLGMKGYKLGMSRLGYYAHSGRGSISPLFFRSFMTTFPRSGNRDRVLSPSSESPVAIILHEALREAERLRTPAVKRAGRFIAHSFRAH